MLVAKSVEAGRLIFAVSGARCHFVLTPSDTFPTDGYARLILFHLIDNPADVCQPMYTDNDSLLRRILLLIAVDCVEEWARVEVHGAQQKCFESISF